MSNVIQFPKNTISSPKTEEEMVSGVDNLKYNHVEQTMDVIVPMLFHNMELAGFTFAPLDDSEIDDYLKDGSFLVESIKSILYKYHNIYHPFQDIADNIFLQDDEGNYTLAKKLEVDLQNYRVEQDES